MKTIYQKFLSLACGLLLGAMAAGPAHGASSGTTTVADLMAYAGARVALIYDDPSTWSDQRKACAAMTPGINFQGASFNGFHPWSADSGWNQDISGNPIDPNSTTWLQTMDIGRTPTPSSTANFKESDGWGAEYYGFPIMIVGKDQPKVDISQDMSSDPVIAAISGGETFPSVSDPGPFPIPNPPVIAETLGPTGPDGNPLTNYLKTGDKQMHIIDKDLCVEHEFYDTIWYQGQIHAATSATYDLLGGDHQRPTSWSGGSVSGIPHIGGLIRYEEIAAGHIDHPLTFTGTNGGLGRTAFTDMASNQQLGLHNNPAYPPFGARMRLKSSFDITPYGPQSQIVLQALKKYGAIFVDGGHSADFYYAMDPRWHFYGDLYYIDHPDTPPPIWVTPDNFEFIQSGPIYSYDTNTGVDPTTQVAAIGANPPPTGPPPTISLFEVYPSTLTAGDPAIAYWTVSGESMRFLSTVGALRANWAIVYPSTTTTTFTLTAQNQYGRVTATANFTVSPAPPSAALSVTASQARVIPNPWRADKHAGKNVIFADLASGSTVKLFTVSGREIRELSESGGQAIWNLSNDSGSKVGSGIYIYVITDSQGNKARGKLAVIK